MEYFQKYFPEDHLQNAAFFTNKYHLSQHGCVLNASAADIKNLYGLHIIMGCLAYPKVRMYWSEGFGLAQIKNAMTRDKFFTLRNSLHFVDILQPPTNKLFKIQPVIDCVRSRCQALATEITEYSIDEQMIPFTGRASMRQYVKNKPRPVGLKNLVVATSSGLVVDFEIFQGAGTFSDTGLGVGPSIVIRLTKHLPKGSFLYFDRYFTTIPLLEKLLELGYKSTGTIALNRLPVQRMGFPLHRNMNRGDISQFVQGSVVAVKRRDSKCVTLVSTECGKDPVGVVQRWYKKERKHINVPCPQIVKRYNTKMGGFDAADQSMEYYRIFIKTKNWTVKTTFHLIGMVVCNAWREYRADALKAGIRKKNTKDLFKFKSELGEVVAKFTERPINPPVPYCTSTAEPAAKRNRPLDPPVGVRTDRYDHWPEAMDMTTPWMWRVKECTSRTRIKCSKCDIFLCLTKNKNCFQEYHTKNDRFKSMYMNIIFKYIPSI
ncbi:piggyBac transposable element-derived protein 3-like [Bactrocera dorsalis]|uniref:PiggyBac transposable element-derived protein 3-like n=1 Tax=Bactrocera dorsalis TaxID=27457 RepID=A0ABM3K4X3_BACDO|nr:piggyBac transposable element-derived protein 3-like [Bactrocera dorsalis]XP_049316533.1 piggyBac transposable element-derived protein 3-like [Bactrocera dorsalis]XP_049316534.1 piggyBac transposable element-derived protein 3-like [Bactrocera dorsalis]XP_049316535.1 piggyBac transposable element-derived protein 3-like [Bactrocera dorsalis]